MKTYYYHQYIIHHGEFGWFAEPINEDPNKERWGYSLNFTSRIAAEAWVDEQE